MSLFWGCLLSGIPTTISAGMQIRCQAPSFSLAMNMSNRFAMQNCQVYTSRHWLASAETHRHINLHNDMSWGLCQSLPSECLTVTLKVAAAFFLAAVCRELPSSLIEGSMQNCLKLPPPLGRAQSSASSKAGGVGGGESGEGWVRQGWGGGRVVQLSGSTYLQGVLGKYAADILKWLTGSIREGSTWVTSHIVSVLCVSLCMTKAEDQSAASEQQSMIQHSN